MKLAFSTLGCPDFNWAEIYSMAKDFGFSGIEMRGLGGDIFSITARPFQKENLPGTVKLRSAAARSMGKTWPPP